MTTSDVIETRNARVWLGDDGIVRCVVNSGVEETLDAAKENVAAIWKACEGRKRPLLVDISAQKSATKEAHEYYAGDEAANACSAVVLLVGSPVSRVIGSFFLRFRSPKYQIKVFTSEVDAVEWLKGFLK